MPKYIDTEKIPYSFYSDENTATEGIEYVTKGIIESRVPTEDVMLIKHGYWKPIYTNKAYEIEKCAMWFKCSECKCQINNNGAFTRKLSYEFCPYCGTKMDKESDDNG